MAGSFQHVLISTVILCMVVEVISQSTLSTKDMNCNDFQWLKYIQELQQEVASIKQSRTIIKNDLERQLANSEAKLTSLIKPSSTIINNDLEQQLAAKLTSLIKMVRAIPGVNPYTVFQERKTWPDADASCKKIGQRLASFRDVSEWQELIDNEYAGCGIDQGVWTSGMKLDNGSWIWDTNQREIDSELWASGEPSGDGDCVGLHDLQDHFLNDAPCRYKQCYICEL